MTINVRAIRERMNLTQRQFAGRFGFPVATLRHWERGNRKPAGTALVPPCDPGQPPCRTDGDQESPCRAHRDVRGDRAAAFVSRAARVRPAPAAAQAAPSALSATGAEPEAVPPSSMARLKVIELPAPLQGHDP
jgi:hypothetical protein